MLLQECIYSYILKIDGNVAPGVRLVLTLWESNSTAKHDIIFFDRSIGIDTSGWVALSLFLVLWVALFFFVLVLLLFLIHSAPFGPPNVVLLQVLCAMDYDPSFFQKIDLLTKTDGPLWRAACPNTYSVFPVRYIHGPIYYVFPSFPFKGPHKLRHI